MDRSQPAPGSAATDAVWQLDLLGQVRLRNAQVEISRWPSRAVAALLARLALAPQRTHPREELIELLWPGVSLDKGRPRLRQALSLLRGLLRATPGPLPEALLADRLSVRIHPRAVACDVLQFEHHLAAGTADRARALYAGELMPGYYDDWIVAERHRLLALADGLPAVSDPARPAGAALPAPQPAELGLAAPTAPPRVRLPAYWTRAFGQQAAAAQLQRRLLVHRLVTLIGPGGNGKTRLAVAVAAGLADTLPAPFEQVVFVPLADAHDPQAVWAALAQALADEPRGDPARQVRGCIGRRALLLVLDNVEQFDALATGVLTELLQAGPGLHLLLTSRRRLGLPGEQVFEMPGLPLPDAGSADHADGLQDNAALALFVDRARESRPEFQLGPHNAGPVVALVRLLGGMPLAIELAASRLRALQPRELLERLQQDGGTPLLDLLARPSASASAGARHTSMRHAVAWSWRQLRPALATLLRAMSVFGAPATAAAVAQALAALTITPPGEARGAADAAPHDPPAPDLAQVQALLAEAVDTSLVQTVAPPQRTADQPPDAFEDGTLYCLLPPVREYAAEQCGPAEPAALRGRLRRWLAALARDGLPRHRDALQPDLRHAWRLLLQARDDAAPREALALTVALQGEMNWRPSVPALLQLADWALADAAPARPGAPAQDALTSQGHYIVAALAQLRAQSALAAHHAEQAVATAPDARNRALALSIRAWVAQQRGDDPATVQPGLGEALDLARRGNDARVLAMVLRTQAEHLALHRRDDAAAEPLLRDSVRLFEQVGDSAQAWLRQTELAACWARSGRADAALALLQACLRHRPAMGSSLVMIYALTELGRVQLQLRQPRAAQAALQEAVELALQHDWPSLLMPALLSLPQAWLAGGQAEPAALLQGHVLASWPAMLGRFNALDARALRRNRRLLRQALGPVRADALQRAGQALTREQALRLLDGAVEHEAARGQALGT